jgi:hypothetical protein
MVPEYIYLAARFANLVGVTSTAFERVTDGVSARFGRAGCINRGPDVAEDLGTLAFSFAIISALSSKRTFSSRDASNDAIAEGHIRLPASEFVHFEPRARLVTYIKSAAVALRSNKNVIAHCRVHGLRKGGF